MDGGNDSPQMFFLFMSCHLSSGPFSINFDVTLPCTMAWITDENCLGHKDFSMVCPTQQSSVEKYSTFSSRMDKDSLFMGVRFPKLSPEHWVNFTQTFTTVAKGSAYSQLQPWHRKTSFLETKCLRLYMGWKCLWTPPKSLAFCMAVESPDSFERRCQKFGSLAQGISLVFSL